MTATDGWSAAEVPAHLVTPTKMQHDAAASHNSTAPVHDLEAGHQDPDDRRAGFIVGINCSLSILAMLALFITLVVDAIRPRKKSQKLRGLVVILEFLNGLLGLVTLSARLGHDWSTNRATCSAVLLAAAAGTGVTVASKMLGTAEWTEIVEVVISGLLVGYVTEAWSEWLWRCSGLGCRRRRCRGEARF